MAQPHLRQATCGPFLPPPVLKHFGPSRIHPHPSHNLRLAKGALWCIAGYLLTTWPGWPNLAQLELLDAYFEHWSHGITRFQDMLILDLQANLMLLNMIKNDSSYPKTLFL